MLCNAKSYVVYLVSQYSKLVMCARLSQFTTYRYASSVARVLLAVVSALIASVSK